MHNNITIYLGADHGGFKVKELLKSWLEGRGYTVEDKGAYELDPDDDYPFYARDVASDVARDPERRRGILVCRTGEGMDIVANKIRGIRATVGVNEDLARKSREHNDANVLTLAADYQSIDEMKKVVTIWLEAVFPEVNGERHERRVRQIEEIERNTMR